MPSLNLVMFSLMMWTIVLLYLYTYNDDHNDFNVVSYLLKKWIYKLQTTCRLKIHVMSHNQLGNTLFHMASCYGLAKGNNRECVYHTSTSTFSKSLNATLMSIPVESNILLLDKHRFVIDRHPMTKQFLSNITVMKDARNNVTPTSWFFHMPPKDIILDYNMCRYTFFNKWEDEIRTLFKFSPQLQQKAKKKLHEVKTMYAANIHVTYVGIHNRRGDFLRDKSWLQFPKASYFNKSINHYIQKYSQSICVFLVFSDNIKWMKSNLKFRDIHIHFIEGQSPLEDMATMSYCNHSIISFGTFGWWCAFFAGGDVLYYKAKNKHRQYYPSYEKNQEYYIDNWIAMSGWLSFYHALLLSISIDSIRCMCLYSIDIHFTSGLFTINAMWSY